MPWECRCLDWVSMRVDPCICTECDTSQLLERALLAPTLGLPRLCIKKHWLPLYHGLGGTCDMTSMP